MGTTKRPRPGGATRLPSRAHGLRLALALMVATFATASVASAQSVANEYEVKAAYLYNFSKFVEWPRTASLSPPDDFPICVLGRDPFGAALDGVVAGTTVDEHAVVVRRIGGTKEAAACRVVFVSASEEPRLAEVLAGLKGYPVLTVSDCAGFSRRGGMIQFVTDGNRVRFEVNVAPAEKVGLTLRSDLLKVALTVRLTQSEH
jgi:hypothetical protein